MAAATPRWGDVRTCALVPIRVDDPQSSITTRIPRSPVAQLALSYTHAVMGTWSLYVIRYIYCAQSLVYKSLTRTRLPRLRTRPKKPQKATAPLARMRRVRTRTNARARARIPGAHRAPTVTVIRFVQKSFRSMAGPSRHRRRRRRRRRRATTIIGTDAHHHTSRPNAAFESQCL